MEIMQPMGYVKIFGDDFYVFKVIGQEVYYYENCNTGVIKRIDLRNTSEIKRID